jgi:hypothetical protein
VPVELGLEDEPLLLPLGDELLLPDVLVSLELEDEPEELLGGVVLVDGGVDGVVVVGGEADGGEPPGRSPTRSVRDSLQAVSSAALSATAQRPVSTLFISEPPPVGVTRTPPKAATHMPLPALTGPGTTITNAGAPQGQKETHV